MALCLLDKKEYLYILISSLFRHFYPSKSQFSGFYVRDNCPFIAENGKNQESSIQKLQRDGLLHGLRTPNEAFFHWNRKLLGLGRQIGQMNFWAFGVFSADYQHQFWYSCESKVSFLGVDSLWGDCVFFPVDWGS